MQPDKVPHKKVSIPNKRGAFNVYYISRYPEGDAHIHVSYPHDKEGYAGSTINFLMEDGSIESVEGPFCLDGMFDHGASKMLAELLKDPSIAKKCYRLTVGVNLSVLSAKSTQEIIYQETEFNFGDLNERIKPEWEGLRAQIEGRGFTAYKHIKNGKIT